MRRFLTRTIGVILALTLTACGASSGGSGGASTSKLTGTTSAIMTQLLADVAAVLPSDQKGPITGEVPMTADTAPDAGITTAQFTDLVTEATVSTAMIGTFAHQVVLVQAKDAASAAKLKTDMAGAYDPGKWICVFPEQASVVDSGNYVLLVATTKAYAAAMLDAFAKEAGKTGDVNTFYKGPA